MTRHSLRVRLLLTSAASIAVALGLAGFGMVELFERHVERRQEAELASYVGQLAGALRFADDGTPSLSVPPADPRFGQPLSGLYWQIQEDASGLRLRSRSLWDSVIPLPEDPLEPVQPHIHEVPGPGSEPLIVQERRVLYDTANGRRAFRIAAGIDHREAQRAAREFGTDLVPALLALALVLIAAAWMQVLVGLRPLEAVRIAVGRVRSRARQRLDEDFPDEIMPLVGEVNDLLAAQERAMDHARNRAADLAHGLKTPLTVLVNDARRLRARGEDEIAGEIENMVGTMRQHIDHELARARLAAGTAHGGAACDLVAVARGVVATLQRTPHGEALAWRLALPERCAVAVDANDLAEIVGNLAENAVKWARDAVTIEAVSVDGAVRLTVADNGPGVPDDQIDVLGARGLRLDERMPGSGMGLAIAREIAEAYGGALSLANAPRGGLVATVTLPVGTAG